MLISDRMSPLELRASAGLASIYGLRMLGMFLILPVFAVYAEHLPGGESQILVGLALGVYGLTQAILQLPFGMASDHYGRKRVIYFGLVLFAIGSFIAAMAQDIEMVIIGRSIQGAGAINAAVTALLADLTREEHRTKSMAMIGGTIGFTFALSLVLGPALYHLISIPGIFALTGVLALLALAIVKFAVPDPKISSFHSDAEAMPAKLLEVLRNPELARLNFGIFVVHVAQMSMFVVVPLALRETGGLDANHHWQVYLPILVVSFALMVPPILYGEKKGKIKEVFIASIALMLLAEVALGVAISHFWALVLLLGIYFVSFNILEASLPSLVSRVAPARSKGTAMGVFNSFQSFGLFAGGALGGLLSHYFGASAVFLFGAGLVGIWLFIASSMKQLSAVRNLAFHVREMTTDDARLLEAKLALVLGVTEATVIAEEGVAYLKVDSTKFDEQAVLRLLPAV